MHARSPVRPHPFYLVVEESDMKRGCEATENDDLGPNKKPRHRQVTLTTFKKLAGSARTRAPDDDVATVWYGPE